MADISKELQNFGSARKGKDVRGSMISLAEKVNKESTDARTAAAKSASDAGAAASNASYAVTQANQAVQNANTVAQNIQTKADRGDFTGTIQIGEVTTGEPGSQASANNSGTGKDAVIDLTIPRGYKGVSMRMAGVWTAGTEYVNNTSYIDLVTYNGSTYGCKQTHTASGEILPTNEGYWQVIAKKGDTGSVENIDSVPIAFEDVAARENVKTGDTIPTVFGKVKKWFSDLKQAAYMNVVNGVTQSEAGQAVLDAAVGKYLDEKKFDVSRLIANRNITEPGFAMDGKTLVEWMNELNGKFVKILFDYSIDLDELNETAVYLLTKASTNPNKPPLPTNVSGFLHVYNTGETNPSYNLTEQIVYSWDGNYMYHRTRDGDGWGEWETFCSAGTVFGVENFGSSGASYTEENLKILLHNRMKVLVNTHQVGTRRKTLHWSSEWLGVTYVSGELTIIPYNLYLTTCYTTLGYYVAYGDIRNSGVSAWYKLGGGS